MTKAIQRGAVYRRKRGQGGVLRLWATQSGGDLAGQQFGAQICRYSVFIEPIAQQWFDVKEVESVEEVVRQHGHKPEDEYRVRIMFINMVRMPIGNQFIESIVFDAPSFVCNVNDLLSGKKA